jgi:hypothetical protein
MVLEPNRQTLSFFRRQLKNRCFQLFQTHATNLAKVSSAREEENPIKQMIEQRRPEILPTPARAGRQGQAFHCSYGVDRTRVSALNARRQWSESVAANLEHRRRGCYDCSR